jgi:hypothetical protein
MAQIHRGLLLGDKFPDSLAPHRLRQGAEIHVLPNAFGLGLIQNHLKGNLQAGLPLKNRPQNFMAADHLPERLLQSSYVERTFQKNLALGPKA